MKRRFIFAGAALTALAASSVSLKAQSGAGSVMKEARVTQVVKDVKILPAQAAPRPATLSDTVRGDTAVRTGVESRAELTFGDLTIARLGANTIFSFNEGTRTVDLNNGAILLRVPKGSGGTKIQTAAVTAAITGTTVIVEYHRNSYAKWLVLEGTMRLYLKGVLGESILLHAGQMMILNPNATRLSEPVDFDLARLLATSLFIQGFPPLPSVPLFADVQREQLELKSSGELVDTNLVIFGRGTLVTMTDPQSLDVIDRKTAAVTLPTPTATARPLPSPTPTVIPSPTPTASPSPSATPTPQPTPSKFGTPPPIVTFVPYPIDNGTTLQTDPAITHAGVTDFGKIYRDASQDGPFSAWAFTATTPFDNTAGIDVLYGANVPVAAFKFTSLQLVGNPTISTANGGATNLALISVGPITSAPAGNTTFTFTGMQSVLIATQNGSMTLSGISFQNIPLLFFYARGATSILALGAPIANSQSLRLMSENVLQISAPESLQNGINGGTLTGISGGNLTVNSTIDTPTASVATGTSGNGGSVTLSAGGTLTVNSRIQNSYNDPDPAVAGTPIRRSAQGGPIVLTSALTTGTGISLTSGSSVLSLLNPAAPSGALPGNIHLDTPGSDILINGATLEVDRGSIGIQQSAAPSVGTAQITINGGSISSETLSVISRGNLNFGTTSPVNLSVVTLGFIATNNLAWNGGTLVATASKFSGSVIMESGGTLTIAGPADIERFNGGIFSGTSGINILLDAGTTFQSGALRLLTDGSGLTTGANIDVRSGASMTINGNASFESDVTTGDEGTGSNITIKSVGPITVGNLQSTVQVSAGRTLSTGGNISLTGNSSFNGTQPDGGINFLVNNAGTIGTGGNITLTLDGSLSPNPSGGVSLEVNNQGAQIQTGGNISATIGGSVAGDFIRAIIDNRTGFIGNGGSLSFTGGTTNLSSFASFTIINSQSGTPGGTIASDTFVKIILGDTTIGGALTAFIDNSDGKIGGTGGSTTLQINGKLSVGARIDVFGTLTSTGPITAGEFSVTDANAPSIDVGAGGITRFNFPTEPLALQVLHTITTNALTSTGGINFNGPNQAAVGDPGPFNGGLLTINVPSLTFGPNAGDNINGPVTFNGGNGADNVITAGSGGTFTVNATGAITVGSAIEATSGQRTAPAEPSGDGGTVNLNSTAGTITVSAPITVSSNETPAAGAPQRQSRSGGNINLNANTPTGTAINITNTGQLLSLLNAAAPGPGGKITILATGTSSRITVNGDPGVGGTPIDTIRADRGTVDIRHTGDNGTIGLTNAQISADTIKIGALGTNGTLSIGGGRINADTLLHLYATGSNGTVVFISDVTLAGKSLKIIAANTVTVNNGVVVQVSNNPAEVYVSDVNHANYSNFNGGNNSTTGKFIIEGTAGSPTSGANTHTGMAPPPFGPAPFGPGH